MQPKFYTLFILSLSLSVFSVLNVNAQCLTDGHSNVWQDSWISCSMTANPNPARGMSHWIQYDFGAPYFMSTSNIWNANETGEMDRGIQEMAVDYSLDGINWIEWGTFTLAQAPGTAGYLGVNGPDLEGIKAQYVLLTALSNYGDATCASLAEVKFDVVPAVRTELDFTVMLEGAYEGAQMMNGVLETVAPLSQPYNQAPYNYTGTETLSNFDFDMVDWILLEVREGSPSLAGQRNTRTIEQKAVVLLNDGSLRDVNGDLPAFDLAEGIAYHFCIRHRNHLDVLTGIPATASPLIAYDFTSGQSQALGNEQLKIMPDGTTVMFGGDYSQDGIIQTTDYDLWKANPALLGVYEETDGNIDGTVQTTDYDLWFPNRAKIGAVEISY